MPDVMRWRYGETMPIALPVRPETIIEIGDLLYLEDDDVRSASGFMWRGSRDATQAVFVKRFAGVAMQRSRTGDDRAIRVATGGVFEFESLQAMTYEVGDRLIVADGVDVPFSDQHVAIVPKDSPERAIGVCAKSVRFADVRVLVDILSSLNR